MNQILPLLQGAVFDQLSFLGEVTILNNRLDQILVAVLVIILGWLVARLMSILLIRYAAKWAKKTRNQFDDYAVLVTQNTLSFVVILVAFGYATQVLTLNDKLDLFISKVILVLLALKITGAILKVFDFAVKEYITPYANKHKILDRTIIPTLERLVKVLVWATVILLIVSNLGYDVTSLVAGLGIGGLAFALAAQDALGNFIGSISLFADKTFKIGDFIHTEEFDGTVVTVGLRSTRFQSTEGTEIIFPNKRLADMKIENLSRRPKRRVDVQLSVAYDMSTTKVKLALKTLQDIVKANKDTDSNSRVHFSAFGDSALILSLTYWIKTLDYEKGLRIQNDINLKIKAAFEREKIHLAYPTRTLLMHNMEDRKTAPIRKAAPKKAAVKKKAAPKKATKK
jgi:MscS family membrane protein